MYAVKNLFLSFFAVICFLNAMVILTNNDVKYFEDKEKAKVWIEELNSRKEPYSVISTDLISCFSKLLQENYQHFPNFNEGEFKQDLSMLLQRIYTGIPTEKRNFIKNQQCSLSFEESIQKLLTFQNLEISRELNKYFNDLKRAGFSSPFFKRK